jgi:hypothetical protein
MSRCQRIVAGFAVTVTRLALAAWVGGAALFVITSVLEQRFPAFDSVTRDHLATIRFPLYYYFGGICLLTALIASALGVVMCQGSARTRLLLVLALTLISASIAAFDYQFVYTPLQVEITPAGRPRSQEFMALHVRSQLINEVHVGIAFLAAVVICIPSKRKHWFPTPN